MELLEVKRKQQLSREEVAQRLHVLADHLARHNGVEFDWGGIQFKQHVPDELALKIEIEVDDEGTELEIELTW
jgi:amphi-Trp domain-containing protein